VLLFGATGGCGGSDDADAPDMGGAGGMDAGAGGAGGMDAGTGGTGGEEPGAGGMDAGAGGAGGLDPGAGGAGGEEPGTGGTGGVDSGAGGEVPGTGGDAPGTGGTGGEEPGTDGGGEEPGTGGGDPGEDVDVQARYLHMDSATLANLREHADVAVTHPCEVQVVGDSISETFLFLNPLTTDPQYPDMSYDDRHCRIFGQGAIFTDMRTTAASGQTAGWGLEGIDGWGGVRNLSYPTSYTDLNSGRGAIGEATAYPEIATIMFGTNDIRAYARSRQYDASPAHEAEARARYVGYLRGIAEWFLERGVVPVLMTMPPGTYEEYGIVPEGAGWGDRAGRPLGEIWAQSVRDLGREMHVPVLDLNRAMLARDDWRSLLSDGVHPNAQAYDEVINPAFHDAYQDLRRLVLDRD
jgi:hypothetical protein